MIALAAAAGHDTITVIRPPAVETIIIGEALQSAGIPRAGRVRDALGDAVPAHIAALGARANPPIRALDDAQEIRTLIEDSTADLVITTGSTAATARAAVRGVLVDLGAHWLIDGIAITPGGSLLLARLIDGRILACLPGEPASALAGLYTVIGPVIRSMRGLPQPELATAILASAVVQQGRYQDTCLVPVTLLDHDGDSYATPLPTTGPAGLAGWANADAIAVVAHGAGYREDVVELLPTIGA
jgi:molybdopterin molybdotransferase